MAVAVRQVEYAIGNPQRGAVGCDVAEAHDHVGSGLVGTQREAHDRCAENLDALLQARRVPGQRETIVGALVAWHLAVAAERAPLAAADTAGLW